MVSVALPLLWGKHTPGTHRCTHTTISYNLASVNGFSFLIGINVFVYDRVLLEQVEHWQEYLTLVNMILFCTGVPGHYPVSETTSSLTLTFWYTLQVRCKE